MLHLKPEKKGKDHDARNRTRLHPLFQIPPLAGCFHARGAGSGDGEDSLHIFGFQWIDRRPDFVAFDSLMQEAATAIDPWIASRL